MTDTIKGWVRENTPLVYFLIGQAILLGVYMVNLEARVSTLETRGSPHLTEINTRLTVVEGIAHDNKERLDRIVTIMTKELRIDPNSVP